jgi:hypothetical protein
MFGVYMGVFVEFYLLINILMFYWKLFVFPCSVLLLSDVDCIYLFICYYVCLLLFLFVEVKGHLTWIADPRNKFFTNTYPHIKLPTVTNTTSGVSSSSSPSSSAAPSSASTPYPYDPVRCHVNCFEHLFLSEDLSEAENWLDDLNPNSLKQYPSLF